MAGTRKTKRSFVELMPLWLSYFGMTVGVQTGNSAHSLDGNSAALVGVAFHVTLSSIGWRLLAIGWPAV